LRAVAHRIVRDVSRAEDVIHEAFAQILRDAKSFDPARGNRRRLDLGDYPQHGAHDAGERQARARGASSSTNGRLD
jgi:sigma-70-like protein